MISWNVSRNDITRLYLICSVVSLHFVVYTCLEQAHLALYNRVMVVTGASHPFMPKNGVLSCIRIQDKVYRYVASIVEGIGGSLVS